VFDCFGAGQKVSRGTVAGRSWRDDPKTRTAMFATLPGVRRLQLLRYLDEAIAMVEPRRDPAIWLLDAFDHVRELSDRSAEHLAELDVDTEYDSVRNLLIEASDAARNGIHRAEHVRHGRPRGPGSDLMGARLAGADPRGVSLRGSLAIAAVLADARFWRCDVLGVDMRDADISGADLAGAIYLTQVQVNGARGDDRTRLLERFERPSHWSHG
jgi:hypothetical protein